jgi:hypothetical protein
VAAAARLLESVPSTAVFPEPVRTWVLLFPVHDMWLQGRIRDAAAVVEALAARPEVTAEGVNGEQLVVSFYFSLGQLRRVERTWTESRNPYPSAQLMQRAVIAQTRNEHWRIRSLLESYSGVDVLPAVMFLIRAGDPDAAADVLQRNRSLSLFPVMVETATAQLEAARGDTRRLEQLVWGGERPSGNTGWLNNLQSLAEAHLARRDIPKAIAALETAGALRAKLFFPGSHAGRGWMEGQKKLADLYRQTGRAEAARDIERDLLALLVAADQDHPVLVELKGRRND